MNPARTRTLLTVVVAVWLTAGCANTNVASMKDVETPLEITRDEASLWERGEEIERRIAYAEALYDDPGLIGYLQGVVDDLVVGIPNIPPPGPQVKLLDTSIRNAFALPHGALYFSTGLLESLDSEAEFAIIAAHELTHYLNRHSLSESRNIANKEKWSLFGTMLLAGIGAALAGDAGANALGGMSQQSMITWQLAAISGYSQELEWEADTQGLEMVVNAGFDASIAPQVFQKLSVDAGDDEEATYYSSHPRLAERQAHYSQITSQNDYADAPRGLGSPDFGQRVEVLAMDVVRHRIEIRDYDQAGKSLGRYLASHPDSGEALFLEAEIARRQGAAPEDLVALYEAATTAEAANPEAWRELGLALRASGRFDEAGSALRRYLDEKPDSIEAPLFEKYIQEMSNQ